jgi:acyl carrier protein
MADELVASPTGSFEQAVARRVAHLHHGESNDHAVVDCDASFFAPTGFYVGEHVLDSLDIVELIVALEVDFDVDIVMAHDVTRYDSIAKLSGLLEQIGGPAELAAFERRWGDDARVEISADVNDVP